MKDMSVLRLLITLKSHLVNTVIMHDVSEMEKYKSYEAELLRRFEDSKCCGNCKLHNIICPNEWNPTDEKPVLIPSSGYCSYWQTDSLSRAERESK